MNRKMQKKKILLLLFMFSPLLNGYDLSNISSDVSQGKKMYNNISNLLNGKASYNFGGTTDFSLFGNSLKIQCEYSPNIELPDLCNAPTSKFSKTFNLGVCSVGLGSSASDALSKMIKELCSSPPNKAGWNYQVGQNVKISDTEENRITAKTTTVNANGKSFELHNTIFPSKKTTTDIYKNDGLLGHKTIKEGKNIPNKLRKAYFNDDVRVFEAYERQVKGKLVFPLTK